MAQDSDILTFLKTIPIFLDCSSEQLVSLGKTCELIEIDPGDIPIHEGSSLDLLYLLLEGEISVEIYVPEIGQVETCRLGPHDILGWSAMTPIVRQRIGTTIALTHCCLLRFDAKSLCQLCDDDCEIGYIIYRRISNVAARSFLTTRIQLMNLIARNT